MKTNINIAIDGPVASGKSTISKLLAKETNKRFISTGLIYRAIAYMTIKHKVHLKNITEVIHLIESLEINFNDNSDIIVNGNVLTSELRKEEISIASAKVASITEVRIKLVNLQKEFAKKGGVIMEGRDIGTVILPEAELKIFLTCDPKIRAQRRYDEYIGRGIEISISEIIDNIKKRDDLDITREQSPLKKASDAIEVNSSEMTIREVVNKIKKLIK